VQGSNAQDTMVLMAKLRSERNEGPILNSKERPLSMMLRLETRGGRPETGGEGMTAVRSMKVRGQVVVSADLGQSASGGTYSGILGTRSERKIA